MRITEKAIILLLGTALLGLAACNGQSTSTASTGSQPDQKKDSFHITATIRNLPDGQAKLLYSGINSVSYKELDSSVVIGGSFHFAGKLEYPQMLTIVIEPGGWTFNVFTENTPISVKGDTVGTEESFAERQDGSREVEIKNLTIIGSSVNDAWVNYNNNPSIKQYDSIIKDSYARSTAAKNTDESNRYRELMDSVSNLQMKARMSWIYTFVRQHPTSEAGPYIFNTITEDMAIPQVEQILHTFSGRATSSPYYEAITDNLTKRKALSPGQIAPDFTLLKPDSSSLTLSSLRGKYVMIDFWASWCHPCREAIPHWKKIYEKYHVKGFEILSVSDDNDWKMWKTAMDKEKMPWHQVCDEFPERYKPARVGALYMTHFIPFYVLLDKEGKILVYTGKEGEIDAALEKLLG